MATETLVQTGETLGTRPRKRGPKSKQTPDRLDRLYKLIGEGQTLTSAARMVGIGQSTLFEWIADNAEIAEKVQEAEGKAEQVLIDLAMAGAKKDGRIAMMMLERRFSHWRKREEHAHVHATPEILKSLVDSRKERDKRLLSQPVIDV